MAKKYLGKKEKTKEDEREMDLQVLKTRLDVAMAFEEKHRTLTKTLIKILDGLRDVLIGGDTTTQKIKYPLLWLAYDNYLSQLSQSAPQIVIEAEGKEDAVKKAYWKGILNYKKRILHVDDLREQFIDSLLVSGKGVYKIGRVVETKKQKQEVTGPDGTVLMEREVEAIVKNETFIEVSNPNKIYISPETIYKSPVLGEECPYVIEEMIKTPEYIYETYGVECEESEKEFIDPEEESTKDSRDSAMSRASEAGKADMKRVRVYAYYGVWKMGGNTVQNCEVLFTNKRILKEREFPYEWGNKKPYVYSFAFKKFFKPKGKTPLEPVMDLDKEYNEHMNRIRTILRRLANPKWEKLKGTKVDEAALIDPDVGVIVEVSQLGAVKALEMPQINPELFRKSEAVEQLFQLITGIVYGATAIKNIGTATGQNAADQGADTKMARLSRVVERAEEERDIMMLQLEQQFAPQEGVDIRVTGADVVQMIKNKKFLHKTEMELWEQSQAIAQQQSLTTGVQTEAIPPPVDEYDKFQISDDGRSVYTSYTREDIQGQFELSVISQSSNKANKAVQAQQTINALNSTQPQETAIRAGLWRRLFSTYGWDDLVDSVDSVPQIPQMQAPPGTPPGASTNPSESAIQGAVTSQANKVV